MLISVSHCVPYLVLGIALLKLNIVSGWYAEALMETTSISGDVDACLYLPNVQYFYQNTVFKVIKKAITLVFFNSVLIDRLRWTDKLLS